MNKPVETAAAAMTGAEALDEMRDVIDEKLARLRLLPIGDIHAR